MSTRNHPASVVELDAALGTPGSQIASKRVGVVEERIFAAVLDAARAASRSGRTDRIETAFVQPIRHLARIIRHRPEVELDQWLENFIREQNRSRP